jgi:uncharacterized protein YyaL (SSP411 family)
MSELPGDEQDILAGGPLGILHHLWAMTRQFPFHGRVVAYLRIYARAAQEERHYPLRFVEAQESGYEGIACLDDTARAAVLALRTYEVTGDRRALRLAHGWLNFVDYMQDQDGCFSNFITDEFGTKNQSGVTSFPGGYYWTARGLWALALAWRLTGDVGYLRRFSRCPRPLDSPDMKMNALAAVALLELCAQPGQTVIAEQITELCDRIVSHSAPAGYFRDLPGADLIQLWGYHQLAAVARAGRVLHRADYVEASARTVEALVRPVVDGGFYYAWPPGEKAGLTSYCVTPLVQGLAELYQATGDEEYRRLAVRGCAWFAGDNDAGRPIYDPDTGRCADGIDDGIPSPDCGAESAIEAGLAEVECRVLGASCAAAGRAMVSAVSGG